VTIYIVKVTSGTYYGHKIFSKGKDNILWAKYITEMLKSQMLNELYWRISRNAYLED